MQVGLRESGGRILPITEMIARVNDIFELSEGNANPRNPLIVDAEVKRKTKEKEKKEMGKKFQKMGGGQKWEGANREAAKDKRCTKMEENRESLHYTEKKTCHQEQRRISVT